jgi:RND family efflux transporter MFP subunit
MSFPWNRNRAVAVAVCCCILQPLVAWADSQTLVVEPVGISAIQTADVPSQENGTVSSILVNVGELVEAGQLLATLDADDAKLKVELAEIELQQAIELADTELSVRTAQATLELARLDLQRAEESIRRYPKSVTESQLDRLRGVLTRAELEWEQAKFQRQQQQLVVQRAKNSLAVARRGFEKRHIRAPLAGQVVAEHVRIGEWVEVGAPVFRIVDTSRLRAEGFVVPDAQTMRLTGNAAQVTVKQEMGEPFIARGVVTFVSPEVNRVDGRVRLWVELDNRAAQLLPGTNGRLEIELPR